MEDGAIGQLGHPVRCHAEEEVVVKIDLAITQRPLTVEKFALVLHMKNWKNATLMNARVIFYCKKDYVNTRQKNSCQNI